MAALAARSAASRDWPRGCPSQSRSSAIRLRAASPRRRVASARRAAASPASWAWRAIRPVRVFPYSSLSQWFMTISLTTQDAAAPITVAAQRRWRPPVRVPSAGSCRPTAETTHPQAQHARPRSARSPRLSATTRRKSRAPCVPPPRPVRIIVVPRSRGRSFLISQSGIRSDHVTRHETLSLALSTAFAWDPGGDELPFSRSAAARAPRRARAERPASAP